MLTCIGIFAHVKYILSLVLNLLSFFKSLFKELISYFELSPKGSSHIWRSLKVSVGKGVAVLVIGSVCITGDIVSSCTFSCESTVSEAFFFRLWLNISSWSDRWFFDEKFPLEVLVSRRDTTGHPFNTCALFFRKRTFLTPWYAHLGVRIRGKKCWFFWNFCVRTNSVIF